MSRIVSIGIGALLAFNACGYYVMHGVLLWCNESRVEALRDREPASLTRIVIPNGRTGSAAQWRSQNECVIDGTLYDVVREEMHGDTLIAYCAHDTDEESIDARVTAHSARTAGDGAAHAQRIIPDIPAPECPLVTAVSIPRLTVTERLFPATATGLPTVDPDRISRPPRG